MHQVSNPVCRGCRDQNCEALGELPDRSEFAGLALPKAIPGGVLYRCRNCGLVFRSPILTTVEYNRLYAQASADVWVSKGGALRTDQLLVRAYIEAQLPEGGRILDIGCYTGEFLTSLPAKYDKFGIEMSERAAQHCRQNGIRIVGDDLYQVSLLKEKFDVVTAMDVIEHTSNPDQFLGSALSILSEDGIMLITTGDADNRIWRKSKTAFWYCTFAEHVSFISEQWLKSNSRVNNFRIAHLERFRYEKRNYLKTLVKLCLIYFCRLFGMQPKLTWTTWTAHLSADHLFAAIRRLEPAARGDP